MKTRALRRHINEKLKWKRRLYHGLEHFRPEFIFDKQYWLRHLQQKRRGDIPPNPTYVKTPRNCSCSLCDHAHKYRELSNTQKKQKEAFLQEIKELNAPPSEWDEFDRKDYYWIHESIWDLDDFRMSDLYILDYYLDQGRQPFRIPFLEVVKFR